MVTPLGVAVFASFVAVEESRFVDAPSALRARLADIFALGGIRIIVSFEIRLIWIALKKAEYSRNDYECFLPALNDSFRVEKLRLLLVSLEFESR